VNEAKEMARRDWESQYDDDTSASGGESGAPGLDPTDLEAEVGGSFDDAQSEVDNSMSGDRAGLGGTIGDPTSDFDSDIRNKQAGLGGAIGVPNDTLGGTFGDDQIHAGGEFNDSRGGVGSSSPLSANESDAGLVTNDLQGAVDMNPAGDETRLGSDFDNVESTLSGGFGDEGADSGGKFDSVRSEVERNFSDVSGTVDGSSPEWHSSTDSDATDVSSESGELRFADTGVADNASASADNLNTQADGLGQRARSSGMDLKQRAAEAREQASRRLEDARRELGQVDGKSMVDDVQEKAKGLINKVKGTFDGNKKS
jgi:ElaB/YqjD/DUF883 family membrane-anchored ribosome-binding protein